MFTKNKYKFLLVLFALGTFQFACKEIETFPVEGRTDELIYDEKDINGDLAVQALNHLYTFLPNGFNRIDGAFLDAATDDAMSSNFGSNIEILSQGLQSPSIVVDNSLPDDYTGISRANDFLSKIDRVPVADVIKVQWKAEARFLRAMMYFESLKRYGGVPLVGDKVFGLNDNLNLPRNTFDEVVQYIVSEVDAVQALLLKEPIDASRELGKATQGAALALKARILLYAASPLNNSANVSAKWVAAAAAAKAVMDLNYYGLNNNFGNVFTTRNDKEIILAFQVARNQNLERSQSPVGYVSDLFVSNGGTSPTQELVDAFPMNNGRAITDVTSGYNAADPYLNRDPRFNATIFYNGSQWLGRDVETFEGGLDKPNTSRVQTKTGYYLRKFLPDLSTASNYAAADHNFIIFRYADILLNYAEAMNEAADAPANRTAAMTQLAAIRKRAGITAGTGNLYGLKANMTQVEMRAAIRLERRLELAFEEHRFWDARRWMTAQVDFNKTLTGMKISKGAGNSYTYQRVNAGKIVFHAPRMYRYPIPFNQIQSNSALTQNPGW